MVAFARRNLVEELVCDFLIDTELYPTVSSINEGGCGDFADILNRMYKQHGLSPHEVMSTFDFISRTANKGFCEYMKDWRLDALCSLGVPDGYFERYRKTVESQWIRVASWVITSGCLTGSFITMQLV